MGYSVLSLFTPQRIKVHGTFTVTSRRSASFSTHLKNICSTDRWAVPPFSHQVSATYRLGVELQPYHGAYGVKEVPSRFDDPHTIVICQRNSNAFCTLTAHFFHFFFSFTHPCLPPCHFSIQNFVVPSTVTIKREIRIFRSISIHFFCGIPLVKVLVLSKLVEGNVRIVCFNLFSSSNVQLLLPLTAV